MTMPLYGTQISTVDRQLDFPDGGSIAIRSTHYPDNLRGEGLDFAVMDEAAYMSGDVWSEVVRPMLADRRGSAIFLSTPHGKNWFYQVFQHGCDPALPDWQSFQFATSANPFIAPAELAMIRQTTTERVWQEEYLAQFSDDSGTVFRNVREAAMASLNALPIAGHRYVAGVDWGRDGDYTAITVIDATGRRMVALDRFNKIGWSLQRGRLHALCDIWNPAVILAEANSIGSVNIEALQAEGLPVRPFVTTTRSKPPLIEGLALAIERSDLTLLPHETLLHELVSYTLERLPGGGYRYSAPPGMHDDTVISTALAWHEVGRGGIRISFA